MHMNKHFFPEIFYVLHLKNPPPLYNAIISSFWRKSKDFPLMAPDMATLSWRLMTHCRVWLAAVIVLVSL